MLNVDRIPSSTSSKTRHSPLRPHGRMGWRIAPLYLLGIISMVVGCENDPPYDLNTSIAVNGRDSGVMLGGAERGGDSNEMGGASAWMPSNQRDMEVTPPLRDRGPQSSEMTAPSQSCVSACDCERGARCENNLCVEGATAIYCCDQTSCPQGEMCQSPDGAFSTCGACSSGCDCPLGQRCEQGLCVESPEVTYCCERSPCPLNARCEERTGAQGRCEEECLTACDCWGGESCVDGRCERLEQATYCCERALCPQGSSCEHGDSSLGMCPQEVCETPCDCPRGQACLSGACRLDPEGLAYCCADANCPFGTECVDPVGMSGLCGGEPECRSACDCLSGLSCVAGLCVVGEQVIICCDKDDCISGLACETPEGTMSLCD